MPLDTLFAKAPHKMRGVEALKMSNEDQKQSDGVRVPPWLWALIVSLAIQIVGAAYVTGRVTGQLDAVSYRVGRIEMQIDRILVDQKP